MEPITLTATAITTLIFTKALETSSEKLGEAVSNKIGQLLNLIREKFQQEEVAGKLTKAQQEPNEKNKSRFEQELTVQMEDDQAFAKKLKALMDELESHEQVKQIVLKGIKAKGTVTAGDIEQIGSGGGSSYQQAVVDVEVGDDVNIGDVKQRG